MRVAVDSSVLVALINPRDLWRDQAIALEAALLATGCELFYFDCAIAEAISAAARRLHEKNLVAEVNALLDRLNTRVPPDMVTWVLPDVPRLYEEALALIRSSGGALTSTTRSSRWPAGSAAFRRSPVLTPILTRCPGCAAWPGPKM